MGDTSSVKVSLGRSEPFAESRKLGLAPRGAEVDHHAVLATASVFRRITTKKVMTTEEQNKKYKFSQPITTWISDMERTCRKVC